MKLAGARVYHYELPFSEPLALRGGTLGHREGFVLVLSDAAGNEGWGEISPLPGFSRETLDEAGWQLDRLGREVLGRELSSGSTDPEWKLPDLASSVRFGFELALWNLRAAAAGRTFPDFVSDHPADTVPLNGLLSGLPETVLSGARRMREAGYRTVKLKVGGRPVGEEVALVRELNEILGDGINLRLDANRAWSSGEAAAFARGVEGVPLEYVEEPLADPTGLLRFARETGVPVALDESLIGMLPEGLADYGYVRAVVLKPTFLGGISRTLQLAGQARQLGITPVVSSAFETGIGTLGLLALVAGTGGAPAGLDTYRRLAEDVIQPPLMLGPRVEIPATFAVRRELDATRLAPSP